MRPPAPKEVFPGFHVFRFVHVLRCMWCRHVVPRLIRDLDLPRHGLEIRPLDGTFPPHMPRRAIICGAVNDHWKDSPRDRLAPPRLSTPKLLLLLPAKPMQAMCRFVTPILSTVPPTQHAQPRRTANGMRACSQSGRPLPGMSRQRQY